MAFDWFRRKFAANTSDELSQETTEEATEPMSAEGVETETAEDSPNEDYLEWAKAAFQHIKQKQETQEAEPEAAEPAERTESVAAEPERETGPDLTLPELAEAEPAEAEPAEAEPVEAELAEAESAEAIEAEAIEAEALESVSEAETGAAVLAEEQGSEHDSEPEPEPEPEPDSDPAPAPLSLLARAEAEREARLERLKATAIEEPEPEPDPETLNRTDNLADDLEEGPRITFDENFIWSAEILAAQGRRPEEISYEEITWLSRLRQGLGKTRRNLVNQLKAIVGQGPLNEDAVLEIESLLLQADVGVDATDYIIASLQGKLREEALPPDRAIAYLKRIIRELLDAPIQDDEIPVLAPEKDQLNIWLMAGVNGAGKTTTIGKLAHLATKSDYRCLIAAADTFRAAAVQQVKVWGERSGIEVIANPGQNTDPAAVVFDAIAAAQSRNTELLLIDTAGRLQNKKNLMDELSKVRRIIDKKAPGAKVQSLLVLDATLGQNGLRQAEVFAEAAELSGVILTKLDGTARGGVALAVVRQLGLPIRFIGAGEGISDLRPFSSYEFVEALLNG